MFFSDGLGAVGLGSRCDRMSTFRQLNSPAILRPSYNCFPSRWSCLSYRRRKIPLNRCAKAPVDVGIQCIRTEMHGMRPSFQCRQICEHCSLKEPLLSMRQGSARTSKEYRTSQKSYWALHSKSRVNYTIVFGCREIENASKYCDSIVYLL